MIKLTNILKEDQFVYSPEKIDEFIAQAQNDLSKAQNIVDLYIMKVREYSIGYIIDNSDEVETLVEKIKRAESIIGKQHSKYFDIIDLYDVATVPDNVSQLEKITHSLDMVYFDIMKIEDKLEDIVEAAKKLKTITNNT